MSGRIPENVLEDILSRVDIVEIISGYLPLKRAGRNLRALCPFHHEKTPSFMVSPDRQIYHCFGCGESGNAIKFLMRYERVEFPEAVQTLARKAGVALPEFQKRDSEAENLIAQIVKINEAAVQFFLDTLNSPEGAAARRYLAQRGMTQETARAFKIGFSAEKWDGLLNHLRAKGFGLAQIEKAGLVVPRDGGGYYDRFRGRIIFPIFDLKSRPIGFGGRILVSGQTAQNQPIAAKYVNSPETAMYVKGRNLFGLNLSKDAIRQKDYAIIVEGYLDFIMPYQYGVQNVVASLGTALTVEQVRLLKRFTRNVVMVYDPDAAGQLATLRSLDTFIDEEMHVKIASLPAGLDPDLCVRKEGTESFTRRIESSETLFDYKLRCLKARENPQEAEGKARICAEMLPTINRFKNAVLRSEYLKKLSEALRIDEAAVLTELKKLKDDRPTARPPAEARPPRQHTMNPTERLLIKMMVEESELILRVRESLEPGDFQDAEASKVVSVMFDLIGQGKSVEAHTLLQHLDDESVLRCVCESAFLPQVPEDKKDAIIHDCIERLKKEKLKLLRENLHEQIKTAQRSGDEEQLNRLMQEFHQLIKTR